MSTPPNDAAIQFARAQSVVVRYAAQRSETVDNLLGQLASPEHAATRRGLPGGDYVLRGVAADALDEAERPHEAALLRDPHQHVVFEVDPRMAGANVLNGGIGRVVLPGRYTDAPAFERQSYLADHLEEHGLGHINDAWHSTMHEDHPLGERSPEDHHLFWGDDGDFNSWLVHHRDLPRHLAGHIAYLVGDDEAFTDRDTGELTDAGREHDALLTRLEQSPVEEVNNAHNAYGHIVASHAPTTSP